MSWQKIAADVVAECIAAPVTANAEGGPQSELDYLRNLHYTHEDTITKVGERINAMGRANPSVLEIGAYFGLVSTALARGGCTVTAQDVSPMIGQPLLQQRFASAGVKSVAVNDVSRALPYADGSFDVIVCCEMIEHLPFNSVRFAKELRRVLAPGGFAFIAVPNQASLKRRLQLLRGISIRESISAWAARPQDDNWHWREYTQQEVAEWLQAGGFTAIETGFRHYTPPAHPNPIRRALVNAVYAFAPGLMDDIYAFAS